MTPSLITASDGSVSVRTYTDDRASTSVLDCLLGILPPLPEPREGTDPIVKVRGVEGVYLRPAFVGKDAYLRCARGKALPYIDFLPHSTLKQQYKFDKVLYFMQPTAMSLVKYASGYDNKVVYVEYLREDIIQIRDAYFFCNGCGDRFFPMLKNHLTPCPQNNCSKLWCRDCVSKIDYSCDCYTDVFDDVFLFRTGKYNDWFVPHRENKKVLNNCKKTKKEHCFLLPCTRLVDLEEDLKEGRPANNHVVYQRLFHPQMEDSSCGSSSNKVEDSSPVKECKVDEVDRKRKWVYIDHYSSIGTFQYCKVLTTDEPLSELSSESEDEDEAFLGETYLKPWNGKKTGLHKCDICESKCQDDLEECWQKCNRWYCEECRYEMQFYCMGCNKERFYCCDGHTNNSCGVCCADTFCDDCIEEHYSNNQE